MIDCDADVRPIFFALHSPLELLVSGVAFVIARLLARRSDGAKFKMRDNHSLKIVFIKVRVLLLYVP
jgi:hypothetical protein